MSNFKNLFLFITLLFLFTNISFSQEDLFSRQKAILKKLNEINAPKLSPNNYNKAEELHNEAKNMYEKNKSTSDIREKLNESLSYIKKASQTIKLVKKYIFHTYNARWNALILGVSTDNDKWKIAEEYFDEAVSDLENEDIDDAIKINKKALKKYNEIIEIQKDQNKNKPKLILKEKPKKIGRLNNWDRTNIKIESSLLKNFEYYTFNKVQKPLPVPLSHFLYILPNEPELLITCNGYVPLLINLQSYEISINKGDVWYLSISSSDDINLATNKSKRLSIQELPPDLLIKNLKFIEGSGNRALDGLESGNIEFDLINQGRGAAFNIDIKVMPLTSKENLRIESAKRIDQLLKKSTEKIIFPVYADIDVKSMARKFRIEVSEGNGFDADPAIISFETLAFNPPEIRVDQIAIDDNEDREGEGFSYGNGNSIIEPGESIEVTAYVQNFGTGDAHDVKAEINLNTNDRHITFPDKGKIYKIGDLPSGDYKRVQFYFYTSRRYNEESIPFSITITEDKQRYGLDKDLGLKLGKRTQNIVDVKVAKVYAHRVTTEVKQIEGIYKPSDVDIDIPITKIKSENTLAIILGVEEYKYAPRVDYAENDAQVFYKYAKNAFGIPERNIFFRVNDGATSGEFDKIFTENGWLARRIKPDETDVIIYFSGHGAPDINSKKGFLIPYDIDPNYANTGFSLDQFYESISMLNAKSVTVFIDACFSGISRTDELLIAGIRPISISIKNPILQAQNIAVISAATDNQYSTSYPDKYHGLFTYFLLKGLKNVSNNKDKMITVDGLFKYVSKNVQETAGYLDKEQNPTFLGSGKNRVLLSY